MDVHRFDAFARNLASGTSRRAFIRNLTRGGAEGAGKHRRGPFDAGGPAAHRDRLRHNRTKRLRTDFLPGGPRLLRVGVRLRLRRGLPAELRPRSGDLQLLLHAQRLLRLPAPGSGLR